MSTARGAVAGVPAPDVPAPGAAAARGPATGSVGAHGGAVVLQGLVKRYRRRTALDGLDLVAAAGAITAVLGPNGAGKTTAVECCVGLRRPDAGQLRVLGLDPQHHGTELAPRVGVLLQDGGLPNGAPAMAVLRLVAAQHAAPMDVGALAALLGIDGFARTSVRRLSGGQRQRLALACAVVGRPEVAFLDEPSTGLDPHGRAVVWELLEGLRAAGTAVLLTTHSMAEAERLADAVVVVHEGRAVATGTVSDLTGTGGEALRFSASARLPLEVLRTALPTSVAAAEAGPGRYEVVALRPGAVDPQVVATVASWCAAHGVLPDGLAVGRRTLEDVVLELTGGPSAWAAP